MGSHWLGLRTPECAPLLTHRWASAKRRWSSDGSTLAREYLAAVTILVRVRGGSGGAAWRPTNVPHGPLPRF